MSRKILKFSGIDFCAVADDCANWFELTLASGAALRLGGAVCANFPESGALSKKFRRHRSDDGYTAAADLERVIPFGCEFAVSRRAEFADGYALVTCDVRTVSPGEVTRFELDTAEFTGDWKRIGILESDASALDWQEISSEDNVYYDSATPFLAMVLEGRQGERMELGCGNDLWRHAAAGAMPGGTPRFRIAGNTARIKPERVVLDFAPETVIPRRPWRFEYYVAWSMPRPAVTAAAAMPMPELPPSAMRSGNAIPCFAAPATRRKLREAVRRTEGALSLDVADPGCCNDAAHLERPNQRELRHWDVADYLSFHLWANRQLAGKQGSLQFNPVSGTFLRESAAGAAVSRPLSPFTTGE